jgi:ribosomal protein S12 methylthiotransferase
MKKLLLISLGCAKNAVDSETILSFFKRNNFEIVLNVKDADVIVINTCGFILPSKQESIDTIIKYIEYGKKVVVTGCLVERYLEDLKESIPEVDLWIPIRDYPKMAAMVQSLFEDEIVEQYNPYYRVLSTPFYSGYLKISDGCDNHCAYCAIPLIRGSFKSIEKEILIEEAKRMASIGVKELVIISQDTSKYGTDIYENYRIHNLLEDILKLNLFASIRLLYLYSYEVTDELLEVIYQNQEVLHPYFDIPIQHASNKMLKLMNRKDKKEDIINLINKIRNKFEKSIIRTTLIVGFPHENEEDFNELNEFIKENKFDHLGVFAYSQEEGTKGATMDNQIDEDVKNLRKQVIMNTQQRISYELNKKHVGEIMDAIVVGSYRNSYLVRTYFNAPDDIDGNVYISSKRSLNLGEEVKVKITSASVYDLEGELL